MGVAMGLTEAIEEFISEFDPEPWDREMLRHLISEAKYSETGGASFCRLAIDLMQTIRGGGSGDEDEFEKALRDLANQTA